jgi:glycosyltransferase involved in cell wall biosynthesis
MTSKRICMLAYTPYERDNRVRRYAETLAKRGDVVDVVGLYAEHSHDEPYAVQINGVNVYRIQHREHNENSKWTYGWRLLRFTVRASIELARMHKKNRYDLVHIHNMPDFLVFAAWYPKWKGAKLILDIHDLVPELFTSKFKTRFASCYIWLLKAVERLAAGFVDHVIIANDLWFAKVTRRSVSKQRCSVVMNSVDLEIFSKHPRTRTDERIVVLFPGSLQWHQGVDLAIRAFADLKEAVPDAEFHIYAGSGGDKRESLNKLVRDLQVEASVKFCDGVSLDEMPAIMANADIGVVPKRADGFGNEAYSTKIMEFMSQGVPVVVSRTKVDTHNFEEGTVHFFPPGDTQALTCAMRDVIDSKQLRDTLTRNGYKYCEKYSWSEKKKEYLGLVDTLTRTANEAAG